MKKNVLFPLLGTVCLLFAACTPHGPGVGQNDPETAASVRLHIFAAASLTESLDEIIENYRLLKPEITIVPTYDSSGTLKTQIENGVDCDLFLSAAQKQMDQLDISCASDPAKNPGSLDYIDPGTRIDLLENRVILVVPPNNPRGIESFDQLASLLDKGDILLSVGNSDVPAGQYTLRIFNWYGLNEKKLAKSGVLSYASNVKEVATQVVEGAVDCGILYATDAFCEKLTVVDTATPEMCGQVIYPAAVLKNSGHFREAEEFLNYLTTPEAAAAFEKVGFTPLISE